MPKALPLDGVLVALEDVIVALDDLGGLFRAKPFGADVILLQKGQEFGILHRPLICGDELLPSLRIAVAELSRGSEAADRAVGHRHLHAHLGKRRSEAHTSELQSLMRISYDVLCLKKKKKTKQK